MGSPLKCYYFIEVFKEVVEERIKDLIGGSPDYVHNWGCKGFDQALDPTALSRGI